MFGVKHNSMRVPGEPSGSNIPLEGDTENRLLCLPCKKARNFAEELQENVQPVLYIAVLVFVSFNFKYAMKEMSR